MSVILFAARQMAQIAAEIVKLSERKIEPGKISWALYKDGFPNTVFLESENLRNRDVAFLAGFETMADIPEQVMALSTLTRRYKIGSLKLILPDYPTGTKDRWEVPGEVVTAYELADMMGCIPEPCSGKIDLGIFDLHALQEESYFPKNFRWPDRLSMMPTFANMIRGLNNASVVFPDDGAAKRFERYFGDFDRIYCEKLREGEDRLVRIRQGNPAGRQCYIVDDRILSGTTMLKTNEVLLAAGAVKVSVAATNAVFPGGSWKKFEEAGFSDVWISDSCPWMSDRLGSVKPFKVIGLSRLITDWILDGYKPA